MFTKLLLFGLITFVSGTILICFEKEKLGTTLMLFSPLGLLVAMLCTFKVGFMPVAKTYFLSLIEIVD